jgi:hypothetical protein
MIFGRFFRKCNPKNNIIKRNRTGQRKFREDLIKKFEKCPLDNLHQSLCEAAHILPYSKCKNKKEKYDVNNGILLSCNMHQAFDRNLFTFDEKTCKVKILKDNIFKLDKTINLKDFGLDKIQDKYISELDNSKSKEFIKKRNQNINQQN